MNQEPTLLRTNDVSDIIRCFPQWSWSNRYIYHLHGRGHQSKLRFTNPAEIFCPVNEITIDDVVFKFSSRGLLCRFYGMHSGSTETASAVKNAPLSSSCEIEDEIGGWTLDRVTSWGSSFQLNRDEQVYALFQKDNASTARASIKILREPIRYTTLAFCFWLAARQWRYHSPSLTSLLGF